MTSSCETLGQACICQREAHAADLSACRCWVLGLTLREALAVRWGAHGPACPVFAPSADPVDRANDYDLRARLDRGDQEWRETPAEVRLNRALGEAAEFRHAAEVIVEWGLKTRSLCGVCLFPRWDHSPDCPYPAAKAALAQGREP